jgi:hypothetical protein
LYCDRISIKHPSGSGIGLQLGILGR